MEMNNGMNNSRLEDIKFVIEIAEIKDGKKLKAIKPDKDGYFNNFPLAVLGIPTRNKTYYDVSTVVNELISPSSMINIMLTDGNLFGEWGHPYLDPNKPDLTRLMTIIEKYQAHHFKKIYVGNEMLVNGGKIIYGDFKPTGPYKDYLLDQLLDPNINNSCSLRSICSEKYDRRTNIRYRSIKRLITFDAVGSGGYEEASKRYVPSVESCSLGYEDFVNVETGEYACESITDRDILNIFGAKDMIVKTKTVGMVVPGASSYIDDSGYKRSIVHSCLTRR